MPNETRFIIQLERPGEKIDLKSIQKLLESKGIKVDTAYGLIQIDQKGSRFVMRGWGTPVSRKKAEQIPGIRFFSDATVKPI